jgi:hypothetical protein
MAHRWRGAGLLQAQVRPAAFTSSRSNMLEGCRGGRRRGRRTMAPELRRESTTGHRSWGREGAPPELGTSENTTGVGGEREHRRSWGWMGAPTELGREGAPPELGTEGSAARVGTTGSLFPSSCPL